MVKHPPTDRFDTIPDGIDRVGAHRAPSKKGSGWIAFASGALVTIILVTAGVVGLALFTDSINIDLPFVAEESAGPSPGASVVESAAPALDPAIAITVLNGTTTAGLANTVGDFLVQEGWGGAAIGVGSRANAGSSDVESTVVFYADAASEGAARALVETLGVGEIRLSADYPTSPITVLVGSDFAFPAG